MLDSASRFQIQFVLVSAGRHQSARRPASASANKKQPAAVCGSYRCPVPASASEPASQPCEPDRKTDRDRATSEPGRQLGRQTAANRIAIQLIRQVGSQVAAAASLQQALFFGALLCSTSLPAETRLTVYRRSQHFEVVIKSAASARSRETRIQGSAHRPVVGLSPILQTGFQFSWSHTCLVKKQTSMSV